jgi:hypothetical protein
MASGGCGGMLDRCASIDLLLFLKILNESVLDNPYVVSGVRYRVTVGEL